MSDKSKKYEKWMSRALDLAKKGEGFTSPNPTVGTVIIKNNRVLGQGYHKAAGLPHAEIEALAEAKKRGENVKGATMVVTLEPCCHFGKTPPCANTIIKAGIKKVVIGAVDPNCLVCGGGIIDLRKKGIEIITGVLEKRCAKLNEPFFHMMKTGKPLVVIKVACSLDGKIATHTGQSQWISGPQALKYAHRLRARYDGICVGLGTVLADDPSLTYRGPRKAAQPLRIILDSLCRTPLSSKVVSGNLPGKTLIATTSKAPQRKMEALAKRPGVRVVVLPGVKGNIKLKGLVNHLSSLGLNSLLIEGGGTVLASALEEKIVDKARIIMAPIIIGGKSAPSVIGGKGFATLDKAARFKEIKVGRLGNDMLIKGYVEK